MSITVKSGYWNDSYSFISGKSPLRRRIKQIFRKRSMAKQQELLVELTGTAVGATAKKQYSRIKGQEPGGKRTVETVDIINRVTTTDDATDIDNLVTTGFGLAPSAYPGDKAGNGK